MKREIVALIMGFLFAVGLGISGMTHPERIIGFLDIFGRWDPTMLFVISGAVSTYAVSWLLIKRRSKPLLDRAFQVPTNRNLDAKLWIGSAIFGAGWGLGGFCPGPAMVAVVDGASQIVWFIIAMLVGMALHIVVINAWQARGKTRREDA